MLKNKTGKWATWLFVCVAILPFLGLMIMDYQLKEANSMEANHITGATISEPEEFSAAGPYAKLLSLFTIIGLAAFGIVSFVVGKVRTISFNKVSKPKKLGDSSISDINMEIEKLQRKYRNL